MRKLRSLVYYTLERYRGLILFWLEGEFLIPSYPYIRLYLSFISFQLRLFNPVFSLHRRPFLILTTFVANHDVGRLDQMERAWRTLPPTWSPDNVPSYPIRNISPSSSITLLNDPPHMDYPEIDEDHNEVRFLCNLLFYLFELVGCDRLLTGSLVTCTAINLRDRDTALSSFWLIMVRPSSSSFFYSLLIRPPRKNCWISIMTILSSIPYGIRLSSSTPATLSLS